MLVAAMRSEMETGRPPRGAGINAANGASPIGPAKERLEMSPRERPTKPQRAGINSIVRLQGTVVE